jgi:hypothetical protein
LKSKKSEEEYKKFCQDNSIIPDLTLDSSILSAYFLERNCDGSVSVKLQDSKSGIPFDTFAVINGKPMTDSSLIYEITAE